MGTIYLEKTQFKKATDAFKETLKLEPRFSDAWKAIGKILLDNNQIQNAIKYF